jgi:DNA mismatch endonuclease, patch repair protein
MKKSNSMEKEIYENVSSGTRTRMQKIRQKNTSHEMVVRKIIFSLGYRYRLHVPTLPGKPDIVFPRLKKVVFVHGCFWHGHENCRRARLPINNSETWGRKIARNVERDLANQLAIEAMGWRFMIVWGCELSSRDILKQRLCSFLAA